MTRTRSLLALTLFAVGLAAGAALADMEAADDLLAFTGDRAEAERLIEYYQEIELTPEQEAVRVAALEAIPAACCKEFPAATCCCECNLSRAIWGLSKVLITTLGYDAEQVRAAVTDYYAAVNPDGFPGDSCGTGKCGTPFAQGGCGGMRADQLVF